MELGSVFSGNDGATLVLTTLLAGAVGQLLLAAVGAIGSSGRGQEVVAAALGGALFAVAPFWVRHGASSRTVLAAVATESLAKSIACGDA
jgi:hypothetical protein